MRILFLSRRGLADPSGAGIRARMTIGALEQLGDVEVVAVRRDDDWTLAAGLQEVGRVVRVVDRVPSRAERVRWLATRPCPRRDLWADTAAEAASVSRVVDPDVHLVWCSGYDALGVLPAGIDAPVVCDLVDWQGDLALQEVRRAGVDRGRMRRAASMGLARLDRQGLRRAVQAVVDRSAITVLSSEADRAALGIAGVRVLENAYPTPAEPIQRPDPSAVETAGADLLLAGTLSYGPNQDAARWFVSDVLPMVLSAAPATRLRLVGQTNETFSVPGRPEVTVVGPVPSMAPELARASISIAPLLNGTGSRIKILEAFANRVPVVATTVGAASLAVTPGEHLLIADSADEFARACVLILRDPTLADRLADAAELRYSERYSSVAFSTRVHAIVAEATAWPSRR